MERDDSLKISLQVRNYRIDWFADPSKMTNNPDDNNLSVRVLVMNANTRVWSAMPGCTMLTSQHISAGTDTLLNLSNEIIYAAETLDKTKFREKLIAFASVDAYTRPVLVVPESYDISYMVRPLTSSKKKGK